MGHRGNIWMAAGLVIAVLAWGCSTEDSGTNGGNQVTDHRIGPQGGTIEMPGVAKLVILPGSLTDTVDFTISQNSTPPPPTGAMGFISAVCAIGPSGTDFSTSAILTITYSESKLGGAEENSVKIYTNHGNGWTLLSTTLDTMLNTAQASISHLSDFAAMADTSSPVVLGVYAKLVVARSIMSTGSIEPMRIDLIEAAFDSAYTPCNPVQPIDSVSVTCNGDTLVYNADTHIHTFPQFPSPLAPFITLDGEYTFTVTGDNRVPSLTASITFPADEPNITYPGIDDTVQTTGFDVTWADPGAGTVEIIMTTMTGDSVLLAQTANDGAYSISAGTLSGLSAGMYSIILNHYTRHTISADGYDSRSFIAGRVVSTTLFNLE